jgi:hypothetical protein
VTYEAYVADGDKALVFTGETQEEAKQKAQDYAYYGQPSSRNYWRRVEKSLLLVRHWLVGGGTYTE